MKKSLILLFVLLLFSVLPIVAFATNETGGSTDVSYTVEEPTDPTPTPPPPEQQQPPPTDPEAATYEINIPAQISLNAGGDIRITANYMNIADPDRAVIVSLSGNTFDNGTLWLTNSSSDKIGVDVFLVDTSGTPTQIFGLAPGTRQDIVYFADGDTIPFINRTLRLVPSSDDIATAAIGTYTGTVQFFFSMGYK